MLRDESFFLFLRGGGLETGLYFGASIVFHAITGFSVYNFFGGYWLALKKKIQTQYLNSRKHSLDFSFPMVLLARFFFSSFCQA